MKLREKQRKLRHRQSEAKQNEIDELQTTHKTEIGNLNAKLTGAAKLAEAAKLDQKAAINKAAGNS